jgi:hypothetical protein
MEKTIEASLISIEIVYEKIIKFIYYMVRRYASDDMMEYDDLVGDLMEEMVKGYNHYSSKISNLDEMLAVIRQMIAFRIGELRHKQFGTHRIIARMNISIELDIVGGDDDRDLTEVMPDTECEQPEAMCESMELVESVMRRISPTAQRVMDAVCSGDPKLTAIIFLSTMRACGNKPGSHSKIKPWMLSQLLGIPTSDACKAFKEIRQALEFVDSN